MRYYARTVEMPIATAEEMVRWLRDCPWQVRHRPLEEIEQEIEARRAGGRYWAGEGVRFYSRAAWEDFKAQFC